MVEVGLGGRLDSTNVVRPLVSAVTKIERDHMKYLGDTLEKIAGEKAGIAKPGAPFVVGERDPSWSSVLRREAQRAVARARARRARRHPGRSRRSTNGAVRSASPGRTSAATPAVAHGVLMALPAPLAAGCRGDRTRASRARGSPADSTGAGKWLFDVAHNPDGMRALVAALEALRPPRPIHALVSILGDKEWPEMLVQLDRVIDRGRADRGAHRRQPRVGHGVAPALAQRAATGRRRGRRGRWCPTSGRRCRQVQQGAGTILVTGSFHTVGDVMEALGLRSV